MEEQQKILLVDDSEMNRAILMGLLGQEYSFLEAGDGQTALNLMITVPDIDLVLLDIVMPDMDGFAVLKEMNRQHLIERLPVITISSENDSSYVEHAYQLGVTDYIGRPFDRAVVRQRVINTLRLYARQKRLMQLVNEQVYKREKANDLMVTILSHIVEFRNGESGMHVQHIHMIVEMLLQELIRRTNRYHITDDDISLISTASALHDIGKITVPDQILNKPGRLTPAEFEIVKKHAEAGASILQRLTGQWDEPLLRTAYDICRWHHERYDGGGYPDGLKGENIPISAQVVSLADAYDALTSERCYKKAYDQETALRMITSGECGTFNPLLLQCLLHCRKQLANLLTSAPLDQRYWQTAHRITERMLHEESMDYMTSTQQLLARVEDKADFFAEEARAIQFDYDLQSRTVLLSDMNDIPSYKNRCMALEDAWRLAWLGEQDRERLSETVKRTSPEEPDIAVTALAHVHKETRWHRISMRTLWTKTEPPQCIGIVGRMFDVQTNRKSVAISPENDVVSAIELSETMHNLRGLFEWVRLVDPESKMEMQVTNSGVKPTTSACYERWGRTKPCRNCVSIRALHDRTRATKLEMASDGMYQCITRYVEVDGCPYALEMCSRVDGGSWNAADEQETLMEKYGRNFYIDRLTGAYCRHFFEDQLPYLDGADGVAMMDIDHFKRINDTYGHPVGDEAIRQVAAAALSCIRGTDMLIRYGGDEFLAVFPKIPRAILQKRLEDIRSAVERIQMHTSPDIRLSVSIGSVYRVKPILEAVQQADQLMYLDKENRRLNDR